MKRGERYDIAARQTTVHMATVTPIPKPPPSQRGASAPAPGGLGTVTYSWREILGAFQVAIVITTKEQLLVPEGKVVPSQSRWYPVLRRYVDQLIGRVTGFGGDPATIEPSPTGGLPKPKPVPHPGSHHEERCNFTGKVTGIIHDCFGDFTGFLLLTEEGHEHRFRGTTRRCTTW